MWGRGDEPCPHSRRGGSSDRASGIVVAGCPFVQTGPQAPGIPLSLHTGFALVSASNRRIRRGTVAQSRSQTRVGEFVCVTITRADLEPMIVNGLVQSSLEIGIPHIDEMVPSQYAASNNLTFDENAEYLASYFFIRCHSVGLPIEEPTITQDECPRNRSLTQPALPDRAAEPCQAALRCVPHFPPPTRR